MTATTEGSGTAHTLENDERPYWSGADCLGSSALRAARTRTYVGWGWLRSAASRHRWEILMVGAVFTVGCLVGAATIATLGQGQFYQHEYAPAVLEACGRAFRTPVEVVPELSDFLTQQTGSFNCADLPTDLDTTEPTAFARTHRYLMSTVSLLWRASGVRWDVLSGVIAVLHGLAAVAAYALLRLLSRRWIAVVGTLILVVSPAQLSFLPEMRDYAKAPFTFAALAFFALLVTRPLPHRWLPLATAAMGAVFAVAFGIRTDILIVVPLALVLLALCTPAGLRGRIRDRLVAGAAFVLAFGLLAAPVLGAYLEEGRTAVVVLEGLSNPFSDALGIVNDRYVLNHVYDDELALATINAHGLLVLEDGGRALFDDRRPHNLQPQAAPANGEDGDENLVEQYGYAYLSAVARHMPADLALRAEAAARRAPEVGHDAVDRTRVDALWFSGSALQDVLPWGTLLGVALILVAANSLRLALAAALVTGVLSVTTVLQFAPRHTFHLEVLAVAALVIVMQAMATGVRWWRPSRPSYRGRRGHGMRARMQQFSRRLPSWTALRAPVARSLVAVALLAATGVPVVLLRTLQQPHLRTLLAAYEDPPRTSVDVRWASTGEGDRLAVPAIEETGGWSSNGAVDAAYLHLRLGGDECPEILGGVHIDYGTDDEDQFGHTIPVHLEPAAPPTTVLSPVYRTSRQAFEGIAVDAAMEPCLQEVSVVDPGVLPLAATVVLDPGWERSTLHATLQDERRTGAFADAPQLVGADAQAVPLDPDLGAVVPWHGESATSFGTAADEDGHLRYDAAPETPYAYIGTTEPVDLATDDVVLVRGLLESGGLSIGLLDESQAWAIQHAVIRPGPFVVVLRAPTAGAHSILVANNVPSGGRTTAEIGPARVLSGEAAR